MTANAQCDANGVQLHPQDNAPPTIFPYPPAPKKTVLKFLVQVEVETAWFPCPCEMCRENHAWLLQIFLFNTLRSALASEDPLRVFPELADIAIGREP